ncbi:hypothetical protein ACFFHM_18970 [Halalkalibacter kiskunsagensis]|uniref:Beta-hexosaminidase bacterial type N-terminal domain-containing protein n=1 Tax=Halalkalibacter kiskunsagensis TaxID=1548599 RepID=A0ABV6KGS9_9BACI
MKIIYDHRDRMILFGVDQIKKSLQKQGTEYVEQYETFTKAVIPSQGIVIRKADKKQRQNYEAESFGIFCTGNLIIIEGIDSRGVMYGCLEWAERINRNAMLEDGSEIYQKPALSIRGIKYNLPYAPFDEGDPLLLNENTCMNINFWRAYLDMLATNRYNCLSLWSEHPFHLLVTSPKYEETKPFSKIEIERNIHFFKELIQHAKNRGIDVYLFTWNIRITPEVAKGLGLPEAVGDFGNMYDYLIHRVGTTLNRFRSQSETIKDYFREMVLQVLLTYPDLKGLGTSASEWMDGNGYERERWITETYIEAIKQSGRKVDFIHRTNMQSAGKEIKEIVQDQFEPEDFYISWKYSNAHCYSHPNPKFEEYWNAWEGIDLEKTQILYTVRNDDVFTLRWGDPDYVRAYVKGMQKPYVKGFYWGADGYTWGKDFQHIDYGHKTWTYDFERHLFQFQLWGRLSYNPDVYDDVWEHLLKDYYGKMHAASFLEGLRQASKIIPAVNRLYWLDYDFQWHPESCLSQVTGFKTILDFVNGKPMPGVGVMGIDEFTRAEQEGTLTKELVQFQETPLDIIDILHESTKQVELITHQLNRSLNEEKAGHSHCTLIDLQSWIELGRYYKLKFHAALELKRYSFNGDRQHKSLAVSLLEQACLHWERLGHYWSLHNKPYFMARVKMTFGYPYYLEDVQKDVVRAKQFEGEVMKVVKEHK